MTALEFVRALRPIVLEASVRGVLSIVSNPPGRAPRAELLDLSRWFTGLSPSDQQMVERMLSLVARQAVFGVLAVLDGARQVEGAGEKGHLELRHVKQGEVTILSGPEGAVLHELFDRD